MKEQTILVHGILVHYTMAGQGPPLLILHGWGSSSHSWIAVQNFLAQQGYQTVCPDLPGFGKTLPPNDVWGVKEYADFLQHFCEELDLSQFVLAGHSFGGQVAVQYAVSWPEKIKKLILVAPAAIRRNKGLISVLVHYAAKAVRVMLYGIPFKAFRDKARTFLYLAIGRRDYIEALGVMKDVFQKVIHEDMSSLLPAIQAPTLLVWGDKDALVPLEHGYYMKQQIPNTRLEILANVHHAPNLEVPAKLTAVITTFL